ncbi:MAG: XRE family transcriptional regulator [Oleiphilus sp.]|nr:MAG: XRE family transcriptional regulator [Oleiphilus sp.]
MLEGKSATESEVLGDSLMRSIELMGIRKQDCEQIIGVSKTGMRNIMLRGVDPESKTGELCMYLVRVYRALYSLVGGNKKQMKHWLHTPNKAFGSAEPVAHMKRVEGLLEVLRYCDGMRGKV